MTRRSEHTSEKVADLIAEARGLIAHTRTYNFGMWSADKLAHEVAGNLADALEATVKEMHARELHHFEEEQARAKAEAERDEALAVIREALAVIREALAVTGNADISGHHWMLRETRRILSRITDKEQN